MIAFFIAGVALVFVVSKFLFGNIESKRAGFKQDGVWLIRIAAADASASRIQAIISYLGEGPLCADFVEKHIGNLARIVT